jgi:hypothetical protein
LKAKLPRAKAAGRPPARRAARRTTTRTTVPTVKAARRSADAGAALRDAAKAVKDPAARAWLLRLAGDPEGGRLDLARGHGRAAPAPVNKC